MKKLFLHIGFYKTGSTSLQKNLARNAAALQTQGICYPFAPRAPYTQRWQHAPLAGALPGRKLSWLTPNKAKTLARAYKSMFAAFEASGCDTLVLSSEAFCDPDVNETRLRWLQETFAGLDIVVIAYIRRQDTYFLSTYQELIKAGGTKAFAFSDYGKVDRLYFARRLAPWRKVFGAGKIIVRPFAPNLWPGGELLYDFLPLIGASRDGLRLEEPANEGLDYRSVELLRQLNQISAAAGQRRQPGLHRLAADSDRYFVEQGGKQKMQLSTAQAETLRTHFRAENEAALAGSGISAEDFFPPVPQDLEERLLPQRLPPELLLKLLWAQAPDAAVGRSKPATGGPKKPRKKRSAALDQSRV